MRYVIIGNGIAGVEAAEAIRALDVDSSITMVAVEPHPPYCRPMISLVLAGSARFEDLPIKGAHFYQRLAIDLVAREAVVSVSAADREVATAGGGRIPYDRLLVATGSQPRGIEAAGSDLTGVFFLRTWDHARGIVDALPGARRALVAGGGLVGFKAAHGLLARGVPVTMVIKSGYPLSMQVDAEAGRLILEQLVAKGLDVRLGVDVTAFEGDSSGRVRQALLSDGTRLECDIAVIGKGVVPTMGFLPPEVKTRAAIVVDEHQETTVAGIYAAGDCAEGKDVARGKAWVNAIWPVGVEQGRIAGWNMAGRVVANPGGLSRNVIRIFDLDVMTAGVVNPDREEPELRSVAAGNRRLGLYRKLVLRGEVPVGMALVNQIDEGGIMMRMIHERRPLSGEQVERFLEGRLTVAQAMGPVGV